MSEKTSFLGKFFGVKVEKVGDDIITMLASWDPAGADEANIRIIEDSLSKFCIICEEKKQQMLKEEKDALDIKAAAGKKIALVTRWQEILANPESSPTQKAQIEAKIPDLIAQIEAIGPEIDKEVEEHKVAKELFETYNQIVIATQKKLKDALAQKGASSSKLELAKAKEQVVDEHLKAAKILAGLKNVGGVNTTDIIDKKTQEIQTKTEAKKREIEILSGITKSDDAFIEEELAKMENGSGSPKTIEEQLATIKAKL